MDDTIITPSVDETHTLTSTETDRALTSARDRWVRFWAHDNDMQEFALDATSNIALFPFQYEIVAMLWDARKAEVQGEIAAGRTPVDAAEFEGANPWREDGPPLKIQEGVPMPAEGYWFDENERLLLDK